MGRDRLVDQIAQAMARAENASEDHFEAYRHVAEAVAAVVEPLLAEKDKAAVEVVERLLRATMDNPDAGDLSVARHKAKQFLAEASPVSLDEPGEVKPACVHQWASVVSYDRVCGLCGQVEDEEAVSQDEAEACDHDWVTGVDHVEGRCWGVCSRCGAEDSGSVEEQEPAAVRMHRAVEQIRKNLRAGPVVTDEERAALRSACSRCGGLVRLELRCEVCGDLPAVEGMESWTEWRATWDGDSDDDEGWFRTETEAQEEQEHVGPYVPAPPFIEQRTVWASRPVRVEEQGEAS